ncbi:MAG: hypothetical protein AMXMBFR7_52250 [Planctomycetota bacterium]
MRWLVLLAAILCPGVLASDADEMKVKRKEVFEFTEQPQVTRSGDTVTVAFESKDYCDATVAVEDEAGRIVRHLGSGVLGANAPEPFQRNTLKQRVIWDGKDDQGRLTDHKERLTVRVSLGLKPEFEKNVYWSPYKRISQGVPIIRATEEGVFVFEGSGVDSLKLFDHSGTYLRTVYPFPHNTLNGFKDLDWRDFPQGMRLPYKKSVYQQTLLTSGDNCSDFDQGGRHGRAATGMDIQGKQVCLAFQRLNRFSTSGSGERISGGITGAELKGFKVQYDNSRSVNIGPTSVAVSPDGKWAYLTGYSYRFSYNFDTLNAVMRIALDRDGDAEVFKGEVGSKGGQAVGAGSEPGQFKNATSVDCDAQGRVYVSDFMNDRIQVFAPDGAFLKEVKTYKPALVRINKRTGEMFVFSWMVPSYLLLAAKDVKIKPALTRYGPLDNPKEISKWDLPLPEFNGRYGIHIGLPHPLWYTAEVDMWSEPLTVWLGRDCRNDIEQGITTGNGGQSVPWESAGIKVLKEKEGKLEVIRDFGQETVKEVVRAKPPTNAIQHLYVNPVNGMLYLAEADSAPTTKASNRWLEIDPNSGGIKVIEMPFNAIDAAFDINGMVYLRNTDVIVRYDPVTWQEIPFDYGEDFQALGNDGGIGGKTTKVLSGLVMPSKSPVCYHQGGIHVSPKGFIIASCAYRFVGISGQGAAGENRQFDPNTIKGQGKEYKPVLYPGRLSGSTTPCIHIWNKHGKLVHEDAVPGISQVDGVALDGDNGIYFMHTPTRVVDGKLYFNQMSETMTKVKAKACKFITDSKDAPVAISPEFAPQGNKVVRGMWIEGEAEWFYAGVGFAGFSASQAGGGCACWFSRFALDLYARSIVPEPQQFTVGVLDSAGNLILRIGRYGNVDSAGMDSKLPLGGDEVGLFHPLYAGTHTDRRIYISDYGNGRIVSVKVNYHAQATVALKDVQDTAD